MPQVQMMNKFKLELIKIVLSVTRQLLALEPEKREAVIADLDKVVQTGDLSRLPEDIKLV
jgi:hypothetical protein